MRANSRSSVWAVSTVPILRASRMTVTRSEISMTSLSLCVMKMTVLPPSTRFADSREEILRFTGRQHGRRLIEDEDLSARDTMP